MPKIKFTKTELKNQQDNKKQFERFLPTLQLKKQQLQNEVRLSQDALEANLEAQKQLEKELAVCIAFFGDEEISGVVSSNVVIKRVIMTEHTETIQSPLMDTTEEVLKTCLGEDNVTVTPANQTHGKVVSANLSANALPPEEAFLWVMKDGTDIMAIGCSRGQIMSMEDVAFQPAAAINWTPTVTALGDGFKFLWDDGQTT